MSEPREEREPFLKKRIQKEKTIIQGHEETGTFRTKC